MLLEPVLPKILSVRHLPFADRAVLESYGADPERHVSLGLVTCDQDDPTYVALDEATKHARVDVVFARSFYAGSGFPSGPLSGEILGVLAGPDPDEVEEGLKALIRCLEHDACFYAASDKGDLLVFPHVITSLGHYLSADTGTEPGQSMAYLVAPPMEHTLGLDAAMKAAEVRAAKVLTPPTETNYGAAYLVGEQHDCEAAAMAYAAKVVEIGRQPWDARWRR